jgi:hypothetical protein
MRPILVMPDCKGWANTEHRFNEMSCSAFYRCRDGNEIHLSAPDSTAIWPSGSRKSVGDKTSYAVGITEITLS